MNPSTSGAEDTRSGTSTSGTGSPRASGADGPGTEPSGAGDPDASFADSPPLAGCTTLRLGGPATDLVVADEPDQLADAVRSADASEQRLLLLGGGSNLVISDQGFEGRAVRIATRGRRFDSIGDGLVQLTVEAGEDWDAVVADTVAQELGGLECLSGIPGLAGATPVQNVGAYGVEVSELLASVDLLDRRSGVIRTVRAEDLGLTYRNSMLKHSEAAVVLRARFVLHDGGMSVPIRYAELARILGVQPGERADVRRVRNAVLELRQGKGMVLDSADHDTWSAGSFFTNPVVAGPELPPVLARITAQLGSEVRIPQFPAGDRTKLSAAWLIEHAGFPKGYPGPGERVRVSTKHTLALTNRGSAATTDLLALAGEIQRVVRSKFGVSLEPEPVLVDCSL
ncbi:UDP-N-acetylmuramate dehydrogenase [Parasphingorhabdus pacifica]